MMSHRETRADGVGQSGFYRTRVNSALPIAIAKNSVRNVGVCNAMSAPNGNGGFTGPF